MSTLTAYATPTSDFPDIADHTFVYCRENKASFSCWSGPGPRDLPVLEASYPNAYGVASAYRDPFYTPTRTYPDTAGIGIYGVNGVCHQSANCFMFAATSSAMSTFVYPDGGFRPRGLMASYAAYGTHGTAFPVWYLSRYLPHRNNRDALFAAPFLQAGTAAPDPAARREAIIHQFAGLVRGVAAFPPAPLRAAANEPAEEQAPRPILVDPARFEGLHRDFLAEKDALIAADVKEGALVIGEATAERINGLCVAFQRSLAEAVGPAAYTQLTGLQPGEAVRLVDPRIASGKDVAAHAAR